MSHEAAGRITTWKLVLFRMYRGRLKIRQDLFKYPTWSYAGWTIGNSTIRALRQRGLITRTRSAGSRITWSLTKKGRELAKKILR